jgi:hypothetical protein
MDAMVHTTAMRLIEQAIALLRKAATLDPMVQDRIRDALAPLGAAIPADGGRDDAGEPSRPSGLNAPARMP